MRIYFGLLACLDLLLNLSAVSAQTTRPLSVDNVCQCHFSPVPSLASWAPISASTAMTSSVEEQLNNNVTSLAQKVTSLEWSVAQLVSRVDALLTQAAARDVQLGAAQTQLAVMAQEKGTQQAQLQTLFQLYVSTVNRSSGVPSVADDVRGDFSGNFSSGVSYVRWGRTSCPRGADVVYTGIAAGSSVNDPGSGANYLCLPDEPSWSRHDDGLQALASRIYGVEYEIPGSGFPFSTENNAGRGLLNNDAPCAVCHVTSRTAHLMIPARNGCPAGWRKEYDGYLVTQHHSHKRTEFICLDGAPETRLGGEEDRNGAMFYAVQAVCGSLPCPKYVNGWELACVVCTK